MRPRHTRYVTLTLLLTAWLAGSATQAAQAGPGRAAQTTGSDTGALALVLDASGSMRASDGRGSTKIASAKAALRTLITQLPDGQPVGLRVYGHRVPSSQKAQACQDTEAIVPVAPLDRTALTAAVDRFEAKGETPIGLSLQQAAADLPAGQPGSIVLVSDGKDECFPALGPDPCQVARDLVAKGVDVRIETVGLLVDDAARSQLQCVAAATRGSYVDVTDIDELADQLTAAGARARRSFQATGTAVEGGPSQLDAAVLTPGTYTDTILNDEDLWFAVDADPAAASTARLTFDGSRNDSNFGLVELFWVDEDGDQLQREVQVNTGDDVVRVTAELAAGETGSPRRYLRISAGSYADDTEFPIVLTVDVAAASGAASPSPTPAVTATPDAPAPSPAATVQAARGSADPLLTVPGVGLGLLVGLAVGAGAAVALLRRRTGTPGG